MSSPRDVRVPFDLGAWLRSLRGEPPSAYARAVALIERGRAVDALPELERALAEAADPAARAPVHNKRGVALIALGRRGEALAAFCDALECDECEADALVNLGNLAFESGHARDALDYYQAALRRPLLARARRYGRGAARPRRSSGFG